MCGLTQPVVGSKFGRDSGKPFRAMGLSPETRRKRRQAEAEKAGKVFKGRGPQNKPTTTTPKASSAPPVAKVAAAIPDPQGPPAPPAPQAPTTAPSALTATDSRSDTDWKAHYDEMLAHYHASKKWWTSQVKSTQARLATTQMQLDLQTKHSQTLQNQFPGD